MNELKEFKDTYIDSINRGENTYINLCEKAGIGPVECIKNLPTRLSAQWRDRKHFLASLGDEDAGAKTEARSHFGLPPLE